ncbi:uncharacterized protein F4822DRAFT_392458 [Hypoxylon trugodes]|uniref:uncharacterized protein n=1 Tax=Hypoxylon trugodes TaxID=326681 RepID=UPI00219F87E5|nr:uncharacterized protein F4822DRAFT_392458 [Hypoxylon trugodes]KAI1392870.1 hypothetical protein F4822DRAFT_392458 [Hypoxylon trugodes]
MKVISPEEEKAHYNQVLKGGSIGGTLGLGIGWIGVIAASRRYPAFRSLTLPFRAFLVTSTGTFGAIVNAERYSNAFHRANNPMNFYVDEAQRAQDLLRAQETSWERFTTWGRENRYSIVFASWIAAMGIALGVVGRNKYLTTSQKLVQSRMYAQGLTLAVLIASAVFETADAKSGTGRWETVKVLDPNDPEHKNIIEKRVHKEEYEGQDLWKDMVAAEERRLAQQKTQKNNNSQ